MPPNDETVLHARYDLPRRKAMAAGVLIGVLIGIANLKLLPHARGVVVQDTKSGIEVWGKTAS